MGETNIAGVVDVDFDANAQPGDTLNNSAQTGTAIISQQYLNGSLFKSQNGSIWTPTQFEDLKFNLYKASFVSDGTVFLQNPDIFNSRRLENNPITTLPRKLVLPVDPTTYNFTVGERIAAVSQGDPNNTIKTQGEVDDIGGAVVTLEITNAGVGFIDGTYTDVDLLTDGIGKSAVATVTVTGGIISNVTVTSGGSGYKVGDTLSVDITTFDPVQSRAGGDDVLTVDAIGNTDTVFLTNVRGIGIIENDVLNSIESNGTLTPIGVDVRASSEVDGPMNDGSVFVLNCPAHAMEADQNLITIVGALPDTKGTPLTEGVTLSDNQIFVADGTLFDTFEGISTSTGYLYVGGEIMEYESDGTSTLSISERGVDGTAINEHDTEERVFKYELSGVSLTRINTRHQLPNDGDLGGTRDFSTLPIKIERPDRPDLSFNQEQSAGGNSTFCSANVQFDAILPLNRSPNSRKYHSD